MDRTVEPWVARIRDSVDRALALDAEQPVALRTKAIIIAKHDYDLAAAEAIFTRALRAQPNYTSARLNYAESLLLQGRFDDALAECNLALVFDPLSPSVRFARALCLGYARRHVEARHEWALCRAAGEMSHWVLSESGLNELAAGNLDAAEVLFEQTLRIFPELPTTLMHRAQLFAARGDAASARSAERDCIDRFPGYSPTSHAMLAALLRDRDSALLHLEKARTTHDMQFLNAAIEPAFEWLADDTEFKRILNAAGVPGWRGRSLGNALPTGRPA